MCKEPGVFFFFLSGCSLFLWKLKVKLILAVCFFSFFLSFCLYQNLSYDNAWIVSRIGVTQKATFIPVFNLHNTWDCQLGFSSNVLSINRTECGDSHSCSQLKEAFGTGTAELLQVQELWPRQSEDQSPRPWTLSPALPCFTVSFLTAAGRVCEASPLSGQRGCSPIPNHSACQPVMSLITWVLPSSIPLPLPKLPSPSLNLFSVKGI